MNRLILAHGLAHHSSAATGLDAAVESYTHGKLEVSDELTAAIKVVTSELYRLAEVIAVDDQKLTTEDKDKFWVGYEPSIEGASDRTESLLNLIDDIPGGPAQFRQWLEEREE